MGASNPYLEKIRRWLKEHPFGMYRDELSYDEAWVKWVDDTLAAMHAQPKKEPRKYNMQPHRAKAQSRQSTKSYSKFGHALHRSPEVKPVHFPVSRAKPTMPKFSWDKVELSEEKEDEK